MLVASIDREKVAVGVTVARTPVALFAGVFAVTVGAAAPAVVKLQLTGAARATPSAALTVVSRLAVYAVLLASAALGVIVAVLLL